MVWLVSVVFWYVTRPSAPAWLYGGATEELEKKKAIPLPETEALVTMRKVKEVEKEAVGESVKGSLYTMRPRFPIVSFTLGFAVVGSGVNQIVELE